MGELVRTVTHEHGEFRQICEQRVDFQHVVLCSELFMLLLVTRRPGPVQRLVGWLLVV